MQSTAPTYVVRAIKSEHHTALLEEVSGTGILITPPAGRDPLGRDFDTLMASLPKGWLAPDAPEWLSVGQDSRGRDLLELRHADTFGRDTGDAFEHLATIAPNF